MADGITVKLEGVDDLKRALADATKTIRTKAVRGALRKAGQIISKEAKQNAPVLSAPVKNRKAGTVKRNIAVRNSKFARKAGDEGVFVGVRPLRGSRQKKLGKAGKNNPNDPFYWRFLEFGTKKMSARNRSGVNDDGFMRAAANSKGQDAISTFMDSVIPQIEKLNAKGKK